jgi:ADP-ribosylglycohydrolase
MRISTFIVFYYYTNYDFINETIQNYFNSNSNLNELTSEIIMLYSDIYNESTKNTQITHPNFENAIICSVFILMVLTGMIRRNAHDIYLLFKIIIISKKFINFHQGFINYAQSAQSKFASIARDVESKAKLTVFESMGYYVHAFKLCVYFLYNFPKMGVNNTNYKNLYYDIMCDICDLGGDTDTNCAIVGTMIGPLLGYDNFKKELFDYFIRYIPENRTQYTSAFMYIYVDYLEKKYLYKNINTNGENYVAFKKITEFLTQQMNIA